MTEYLTKYNYDNLKEGGYIVNIKPINGCQDYFSVCSDYGQHFTTLSALRKKKLEKLKND